VNKRMRALAKAGVSIWLDDLSRSRLASGSLAELIREYSVSGVTTNPTIFAAALAHSDDYAATVAKLRADGADVATAVRTLTTDDVRDACDLFTPVFDDTDGVDGRVSIEVEPGLDLVESDELRFKQVVVNLLSNAVKFTPDGGHVDVAAYRSGAQVAVTVRDDGPGIASEEREKIFEAFQQGRRGAAKEEGTGLGLTLCRRIVALMGGRMWLESEVGVGSTFGFAIPSGRSPLDDDGATGAPADAPVVVLVDDDRASLDLLAAYLDGLGLHVVRARDGLAALQAVQASAPVAVVLDIRLPGMDGWQVLERMKGEASTRAVPVIIASILEERARGLALGAAEYLVKPVGRDELVDALRRAGALPADAQPQVTGGAVG